MRLVYPIAFCGIVLIESPECLAFDAVGRARGKCRIANDRSPTLYRCCPNEHVDSLTVVAVLLHYSMSIVGDPARRTPDPAKRIKVEAYVIRNLDIQRFCKPLDDRVWWHFSKQLGCLSTQDCLERRAHTTSKCVTGQTLDARRTCQTNLDRTSTPEARNNRSQ